MVFSISLSWSSVFLCYGHHYFFVMVYYFFVMVITISLLLSSVFLCYGPGAIFGIMPFLKVSGRLHLVVIVFYEALTFCFEERQNQSSSITRSRL